MDKTCDLPGCSNSGPQSECSLNQLGIGCCGFVTTVSGDRDLKRRLLEMGLCKGANIEVIRKAPMGDPIEFKVRGYCLSLRGEQAKFVQVSVKK